MSAQHEARSVALGDIEAVYRARYPYLLRVAAMIVGDAEAARDAVQEGFARAIRHRFEFRGEASLEGWLWRIVVNTAKSQRNHTSAPEPQPLATARDDDRLDSGDASLRALLTRLPERQRLALFLRYYADLDYAAIGEALAVTPETVAATLNAAHRNLRRLIEEEPQ